TTEVRKAMFASSTAIKKFEENVLAHVQKDDITVDDLESIAKNRVGLLKHLGVSAPVGEHHPCRHFSLDDYKNKEKKSVRDILNNSNRHCILSIDGIDELGSEEASEEFFKDLPPTVFAVL